MSLRHDEFLAGRGGRVRLLVTDRRGGHSPAPYDGANLGGQVGDDPRLVEANRLELAGIVGVERTALRFMDQVHGGAVAVLADPITARSAAAGQPDQLGQPGHGPPDPAVQADALVTGQAGVALVVLVADCVPVLLADPAMGVIGVAHCGRPGLRAGIVPHAIEAMQDLGARTIHARVGPSVCARCYEVPAAMRDDVARAAPMSASLDRHGRPALDIAAGVLEQLAEASGVSTVDVWPGCTREDPALYSHRRDGVTGRFAGVVVIER